jgi:hypothetical protein
MASWRALMNERYYRPTNPRSWRFDGSIFTPRELRALERFRRAAMKVFDESCSIIAVANIQSAHAREFSPSEVLDVH